LSSLIISTAPWPSRLSGRTRGKPWQLKKGI
jgi:hypothetical protein